MDVWGHLIFFIIFFSNTACQQENNILFKKALRIFAWYHNHFGIVHLFVSFILTFVLTILIVPNVLLLEQHKANKLNSPKLLKQFVKLHIFLSSLKSWSTIYKYVSVNTKELCRYQQKRNPEIWSCLWNMCIMILITLMETPLNSSTHFLICQS